jgi:hypothetical protein
MNRRDTAFASLRDRIYRAAVTRDLRALLDEMALADARELIAVADPLADIEAAHVLGLFRWLRYLAAPNYPGSQDLSLALGLLKPVFERNPYAVPEPLQRWYLQSEAYPSHGEQRWRNTPRLPVFHAAVRSTVGSAPPNEPDRTRFLLDAALMLHSIAGRGADPAVLAEAVDVTLAALGPGSASLSTLEAGIALPVTPQTVLEPFEGEIAAARPLEPPRRRTALPPAAAFGSYYAPAANPSDASFRPEEHRYGYFPDSDNYRSPYAGQPTSSAPDEAGRVPIHESQGDLFGYDNGSPSQNYGSFHAGYADVPTPYSGYFSRESPYVGDDGNNWVRPTTNRRVRGNQAPDTAESHEASPRQASPARVPPPAASGFTRPRSFPENGAQPQVPGFQPVPSRTLEPQESVRHLWAQLPERVSVGQRIPLLVWVSTSGGEGTSTPLKPFSLPDEGRRIVVAVSAPGFEHSTDSDQELFVPSRGDSEPIYFGLHAVMTGLHHVRADAFASGTFLGRLELQVSVEVSAPVVDGTPRRSDLSGVTARPGEVTLQVNRENGAYSFQLIGTSWYPRMLTRSLTADPTQVVERILAELRTMARGDSGFTSPRAIREHIKNLGTKLWSDIVPDAVRRQFWDQVGNISSFVVMSNLDMIPWELLHAVDQGRPELGFLAENFPVVRRVYERTPAYSLPLPSSAYVVPPRSPGDALAEVSDVRAVVGDRVKDLGVVTRLDALQELFSAPPGLLHFACHNTFSPATGSVVPMDGGPVRPDDLEQCKRKLTMAATNPLVFFNACRTAGEIYGFTEMSGWASQFMAAGAGAFVGTLWPVRSATARVFATSFYEAIVHQKVTLGEASLHARKSVAQDLEDPTWLAYSVYGSPDATVPS